MKAAVYYSNRDVRIQEMPIPAIGDDELLVKVLASGICGSDVMEWYRIKKAPLVLGHEIAGEIYQSGKKVSAYSVGDRVFVSHHVSCNSCRYCLNGDHTACELLRTTNFFPGGFSQYLRVPALNVERGTFLLPDNVSFEEGTFVEPLACVARAQRFAQIKEGQHILILGGGISGLLHLLLARARGAKRIFVTDLNEYRLGVAKKLGATVIRADTDVCARLKELNDGRLADRVLVCTSAYPAFVQALGSVDRGGVILCFAPTEPGVMLPVPVNAFWRNSVTITHSYGASVLDINEAIALLRDKKVPVEELITHRLPLSEAGKGFALVADGAQSVKVILFPHQPFA